ncbi:hypothetical protein RMCBS344292_07048 [Rhizopus microsporus]|nr:hypothetical protein RMCBS344292_04936 [Rhizopus microsporus]CEI92797.1 hypothetical protein RMCBS344292_07048 [Rhizopus microsporus]
MKFFAIVCTLLIQSILYVYAQAPLNAGVAITSPVLNGGSNFTISWSILNKNATRIEKIGLWKGNAAYLTPVILNILKNGSIPVNPPTYNWTVPTNLTSESDYVLTIVGNNSYTSYSPYFTIKNA